MSLYIVTNLHNEARRVVDQGRPLPIRYRPLSATANNLEAALAQLAAAIAARPELEDAVRARWRAATQSSSELPNELRAAADACATALPELMGSQDGFDAVAVLLPKPGGEVILSWCSAASWRREVWISPLLTIAATHGNVASRVPGVAADRILSGPLHDALLCAPMLGDGSAWTLPAYSQARARMEILIWEAGASALEVPELGPWLFGSGATFDQFIHEPCHGALRGRVLAARCLEISASGMPSSTDQAIVGRTLQALQPLLLHPEPLVWIHAARALGRLAGPLEQLQGMLLDWVHGDSPPVLRQRAITALASLPAERLRFLASQLVVIISSPEEDAWVLAAVAAATPYLFHEKRDLWERMARRVLNGDGGAIAARALGRGLGALWRRGGREPELASPLRKLREMARHAPTGSFDDLRRWIEVTSVTDVIDGAERDPLDVELGLDNLMRIAAQYDDEEADGRAVRFAATLASALQETRRIATSAGRPRGRAAAINALEGTARAFALRLWAPLVATHPSGDAVEIPDLTDTWNLLKAAPAEILDLVKERRQSEGAELLADLPLEVLAVQLGGYALDAGGVEELGPGRGQTAHDTCLTLRKIQGLADGSRELPLPLRSALSRLFWRLVDTTRGTTLGEVDDVQWLGPFAAWWALVIDRPAMLLSLATALPMMSVEALQKCVAEAEKLRGAVSSGMLEGAWGQSAADALQALHASDTELAHALMGLSQALQSFSPASGQRPELEALCLALVLAADRLQGALADPVKGLHGVGEQDENSLERRLTENAPRVAALLARAIRTREIGMLDVWLASLGPVTSALLEEAVRGAIRRTRPPPPAPKKEEPKLVAGYEVVKRLGDGGIGSVWLVRKPGADRLFVLKIPKADVLASANDTERQGILASFVEEAAALAGLYHPNVANIIDRGVIENVPYLVLEYLIGADLKEYSTARRMTLFELRQVVLDCCAGLSALHNAGLVHRDIKPANLWLRLPLQGGERFDAQKHRDPAVAAPLSTVVIDFGMVRASKVGADAAGRFVAGTAGYIAPEQVLDPVELDPRADVYSLAASMYNIVTGRAFFDDIQNNRDRIMAHMRKDPFEDVSRLSGFPAAVAKLMRGATAMDPRDRPMPLEFGRSFAAAL
jgi:serine/threonine-protein kinase